MKGIIASPGIAIGKAFVLEQKEVVINEALLKDASECEAEVEKFRKAVTETEAQLNDIIETTEKRLSAKEADVFRAHLMMLNDPTLEDAVMDKINNGMMHADKAVAEATEEVSAMLASLDDEYLRERSRHQRRGRPHFGQCGGQRACIPGSAG